MAQQAHRVRHARNRPLLNNVDPAAKLEQLMRERAPLYDEIADVTVATDGRRVRSVAEEIMQAFQASRGPPTAACQRPADAYILPPHRVALSRHRHAHVDTLRVELGSRSYPILIGAGLLARADLLSQHVPGRDVLLVSNTTVAPAVRGGPAGKGSATGAIVEVTLPDGEAHKTLATVSRVLDVLVANRFARDCTVVALGGGVVGDMAGFAAACYQRGVAYVQVPTTLLAQVDSSVGGKTGREPSRRQEPDRRVPSAERGDRGYARR